MPAVAELLVEHNAELEKYAHSYCSASRPIPIAKVKTLTGDWGLEFDLLTSGSVHTEVLPWTIRVPTLVLIFLECGQTDRQTDRCDWMPLSDASSYTARMGTTTQNARSSNKYHDCRRITTILSILMLTCTSQCMTN